MLIDLSSYLSMTYLPWGESYPTYQQRSLKHHQLLLWCLPGKWSLNQLPSLFAASMKHILNCCEPCEQYKAALVYLDTQLQWHQETPFKPSTEAMNISSRPRFFNSLRTESQNLAPSSFEIHIPRTSFKPSVLIPIAR